VRLLAEGVGTVLYGGGGLFLVELCLAVYCTLNVITTPESQVRNLPKLLWLVIVLLVPIVGGIAWLVAGRPQGPARSVPYGGNRGLPPAQARPVRPAATPPDDDEAFLRGLRERAEQQRRKAEQQRQQDEPGTS
jgi:hypothetical protein